MAPQTGLLNLDVEAISGICGSISIACWVVVFSPQIIENFRRASSDGLSLQFIIVWLLGDVFNILGAVLQGVLPTMIILAIYYTIADIVLLGQCFYYRGFTWRDEVAPPPKPKAVHCKHHCRHRRHLSAAGNGSIGGTEQTTLLAKHQHQSNESERRGSTWSNLSPVVPFVPDMDNRFEATVAGYDPVLAQRSLTSPSVLTVPTPSRPSSSSPPSLHHAHRTAPNYWKVVAFNAFAMFMVCAAGVAGWYLSRGRGRTEPPSLGAGHDHRDDDAALALNFWGQVFGYLCAVLYVGSRLPQLLLNWRRQSTDGVSMLFFLFACVGNLTYVLSILAYDGCTGTDSCAPVETRSRYGRYLLVNLSWLAGSLGTLLLDMGIFVQFFLYRAEEDETEADCEEDTAYGDTGADERGYGGCSCREDDDDDDNRNALLRRGSSDNDEAEASNDSDYNDDDDDDDGNVWNRRPLLQRNMSSYHGK